jgi:hypothetical protein
MAKLPRLLVLASFLVLIPLSHLRAQTSTTAPANGSAAAAPSPPSAQAPDEMTRKISELVLAGKYAEAQKLTEGLLIAYPDDQRLIKARALIESRLAPGGPTSATPGSAQPPQPPSNASAEQLTGMDKVDNNALIVLARQAQQTTDLDEQKKLLQQFMDQSAPLLQKHPDLTLLWQLRAASAISLNEPISGYEAGQKLLAMGAADSNDPALQNLLGQLKNKGWLEKQGVEEAEKQAEKTRKYGWILGTWQRGDSLKLEFVKSDSGDIESYQLNDDGTKGTRPIFRGTFQSSGEISWEINLPGPTYPSGWQPVISCEIGSGKRTIQFVIPKQWDSKRDSERHSQEGWTFIYYKLSDSQSQ